MVMRRSLLLGLWFVFAFPIGVSAQSLVGGAGFSDWVTTITSLPGLNLIQGRDLLITSTARVGYKKLGFICNLDIPPTQLLSPFGVVFPEYGSLLDLFPLDAKIQSADLAVGTFRLDAQTTPFCGLFGSVSANIPRTVGVKALQGPAIGILGPPQEWRWTGSGFQWSEFEFGGWLRISPPVNLVGGIRFDRVSVRFSHPEPVPGYSFFTIFPLPPAFRTVTFPDYGGDLNTFFTIPYVGCEMLGSYFKGSLLIGSAGVRLRIPLELTHAGPYITGPIFGALGRRDLSEQAEYTFKKPALFLEASLESNFRVGSLYLTLWARGNWLRAQGAGEVNLAGQSSAFLTILGTTFTLPKPFSASSDGPSNLTMYMLDLGLSGAIYF